jgi:D-psicose/D-tagatose/L-ribulose 3-epimerase
MRIGFCTNLIATRPDGTGSEWIEKGRDAGFDYVELPLAQVTALSDESFLSLKERVAFSGIKCECCNNLFPAGIRLTGSDVHYARIEEYLDKALGRAEQLGAKLIVFGSAIARNVPEGYPADRAWSQLVELLRRIDPLVKSRDMTVVIEPICRLEGNIIHTAAEGLRLSRAVDRENIRLLVDYYHLVMEEENPGILLEAGASVRHIHYANPSGRVYPQEMEEGDVRFVSFLKHIGYEGGISVEAYAEDFCRDAKRSVELLRQAAAEK